jgi:formyltetrahydrofolate deformylase
MTYSTKKADSFTLRVTCPATTGLVGAITSHLARKKCYISELAQYDDEETQRFFMRCVFSANEGTPPLKELFGADFEGTAREFSLNWTARTNSAPHRVLLLVSKFDHCLRDLLYRWEKGELNMHVVGVVSNHDTLKHIAQRHGVPFYHLPVTAETKAEQENALRQLIDSEAVDLIVLARYMQILSGGFIDTFESRIINIHHSFLPAFAGGRPYHQAAERGVKLIGATAHYATSDLDEGPIIEQDVIRVSHRETPDDLVAKGRDVVRTVLSRAVRWHLEDRVVVYDNKTVVFV